MPQYLDIETGASLTESKCVRETLAAIEKETGEVPIFIRYGGSGHLLYRVGSVTMSIDALASDKARSLKNNVSTAKRLLATYSFKRAMKEVRGKTAAYAEDKLGSRQAREYITSELEVPLNALPDDWGRKSVRRGYLTDHRPNKKAMGGVGYIFMRGELDVLIERLRVRPNTVAFYYQPLLAPAPESKLLQPIVQEVAAEPAAIEMSEPPSTVTRFDLEGKAVKCVNDLFQLLHDEWDVTIHCEVKAVVNDNGHVVLAKG